MDQFFESFTDVLKKNYPKTFDRFGGKPPLSPYQVSPAVVRLPKALREKMKQGASAFWDEARSLLAPSELRPELGVCTSFDFHVSEDQAKLIEVNTNASLSLIFHALEQMHSLSDPDFLPSLVDSFLEEHRLLTQSQQLPRIAIVDENVDQQKMRIEFFLFLELFERHGLFAKVVNLKNLKWDPENKCLTAGDDTFDFVYNRHTDFYFKKSESWALRQAYESGVVTITPNPSNYRQLADKGVLIELSKMNSAEKSGPLSDILLNSHLVSEMEPQDLWSKRKDLFFKPMSSHGSKGVYKGKSISRKVFDHILSHDYVAQEKFSPARVLVGDQEFKYDVRLITYGPDTQIAGARLYQGQLTNFGTLGGGAAPIEWS